MELPMAGCRLPIEKKMGARTIFQIGNRKSKTANAFTLIEIMMVVAIMGLVLAMGMPAFLAAHREAPLRKAVNDVIELAARTRSQAILKNEETVMKFFPPTKQVSSSDVDTSKSLSRNNQAPVTSVQLDDNVDIRMLDVNLMEGKDNDEVDVHFYANGTCDEMTLVLASNGQYCRITLDPTTALAHADDIQ
jgi:prepilin-type N-terminal cleavage/methylation domain-containing protein